MNAIDQYCSLHEPPTISQEACKRKIASLIKHFLQVQSISYPTHFSDLICSISIALPQDPLVLACGHIFAKTEIMKWLDQEELSCPYCRRPNLYRKNAAFPALEALLQKYNKIKNLSTFPKRAKECNPERAALFRALAEKARQEGDVEAAIRSYQLADSYTDTHQDIPALKELFKECEVEGAIEKHLLISLSALLHNKKKYDALHLLKLAELDSKHTLLFFQYFLPRSPTAKHLHEAAEIIASWTNKEHQLEGYKLLLYYGREILAPPLLTTYAQKLGIGQTPYDF